MPFHPSKKGSRERKRPITAAVSLTSMMDMFTILILFLINSFSAEGQIVTVPSDLRLPFSTSENAPRQALQVLLTSHALLVDGELVEVDLTAAEMGGDMVIPALYDRLKALADRYGTLAVESGGAAFTGNLILQADREIPFRLLKKVLYTCGQAGFINQSLAVYQKG